MHLKHLIQLTLDLVSIIDQGAVTDPRETWDHVQDGSIWVWLAGLLRPQYGTNFLFAFVPHEEEAAIWEDAGLQTAFALKEGRLPALRQSRNGLCGLVTMVSFLIMDNAFEKDPPSSEPPESQSCG